jgi:hypothetical protein
MLRYFGHVMRAQGLLEWDIMLGQIAGHRRQGKLDATSLCLEVLKETVQDRKKWRKLVEEKAQNRERTNVK